MEPSRSIVAKALRNARIRAQLSQHDVATALGISQPYLSDLEHGHRRLGLRHLAQLPPVMRPAVSAAWFAVRENEITEAKRMAGDAMSDRKPDSPAQPVPAPSGIDASQIRQSVRIEFRHSDGRCYISSPDLPGLHLAGDDMDALRAQLDTIIKDIVWHNHNNIIDKFRWIPSLNEIAKKYNISEHPIESSRTEICVMELDDLKRRPGRR